MAIIGDAEIRIGGASHVLGAPIRFEEYERKKRRYLHHPLDQSVSIDRVIIGTGVTEVVASIRFDTDPGSLVDRLSESADGGLPLVYLPSAADPGTSYTFAVVGVGDDIELARDRQFPDDYFHMWEVTVRLTTTDDLSALLSPV